MLLIKGGNVYLGAGRYDRVDILAEGGEIRQVAPELAAAGAQAIDASGMTVLPGFVLPLCAVGAVAFADKLSDKDEPTDPISPQMDIRHAFDPEELRRQHFCRCGITAYGLSPGVKNLLGGQMAFIHSAGERTDGLFLKEKIALKGNFTESVKMTYGSRSKAPMTRMGMFQLLDDAFRQAGEYLKAESPEYDPRWEAMAPALKGEIPFVVNAHTESELESVIELGLRHGLRLVIAGAFGLSDHCAEAIVAQDWHVVLGDSTYYTVGAQCHMDLTRMLGWRRRGLNLSLGCSGDIAYVPGYEQLSWMTGLVRQAGATAEEALDMLTLAPARALGVDRLVGSLEAGKQADLLICHGNPAERYDGRVVKTLVAGKVCYDAEKGGNQYAAD